MNSILSRVKSVTTYPVSQHYDADSATPICISCGQVLSVRMSGRSRYCARCGCYLPKTVYGDINKTENAKLTKNGWVIVRA